MSNASIYDTPEHESLRDQIARLELALDPKEPA